MKLWDTRDAGARLTGTQAFDGGVLRLTGKAPAHVDPNYFHSDNPVVYDDAEGKGMRFEVEYFGETAPAFVVRYKGRVQGYLNRCAHVAMELDWQEGVFFDSDGRDLLCSTHGATYDAASGRCVGGPCNGTPLVMLLVEERDGMVYFTGFEDD